MNKILFATALFLTITVHTPPGNAQTPAAATSLAGGTPLFAELASSLDSKKAKPGDPVNARLTEAIQADGKIILPRGVKILGHVTQSSSKAKGDPDSVLGLQFDKIVTKDGQEMPLNLSLVAVAAEQRAALESGPDQNILAGTGSAAEAGSPMRQTPKQVQGVNGSNSPGGLPNTNDKSTPPSGLNNAGQFTTTSRGVFGLDGVRLTQSVKQGSLLSAGAKNLHLDSGTRFLLIAQSEAAAPPDN